MLPLGRRANLPIKISCESPTGANALVPIFQNSQNPLRRHGALKRAGRILHILNLIREVILARKPDQTDGNTTDRSGLFLKISDDVKHVRIDVVRVPSIEQHVPIPRDFLQNLRQCRAIEKAHLVRQFDMDDVAA